MILTIGQIWPICCIQSNITGTLKKKKKKKRAILLADVVISISSPILKSVFKLYFRIKKKKGVFLSLDI